MLQREEPELAGLHVNHVGHLVLDHFVFPGREFLGALVVARAREFFVGLLLVA